jgi:hypothetical protein
MTLQGKGFFTFILPECEGGDPAAIVAEAQSAGLSHVIVKIADGVRAFGMDPSGIDFTVPVVQALRVGGIAVWGWQTVRGNNPAAEAEIAIQRVHALGLDGYVVNAETEYKQPGKEAAARLFMSAVRDSLTIPIALSSYRFPNYHPEFPWSAFLEKCDYHMPKVFWELAHNAGVQLVESKHQCDALPNARPYIPTGAAYNVAGWTPTPADILDFLDTANTLGLPAVNFFHWGHCRRYLPKIWTTIAGFDWPAPLQEKPPVLPDPPTTPSTPPDAVSTKFLATLNNCEARQMAALYDPAAVRIWVDEILYGPIAIRDGYATLFDNLPAGIVFTLSQAHVDNDVHYLTWKAGPLSGETTLVLKNGKIVLDYTFIS